MTRAVRKIFISGGIEWVSDGARGLIGSAPGGLIAIRRGVTGWDAFQNGEKLCHGARRHDAFYKASRLAYLAAGARTWDERDAVARELRLGKFYAEAS